jgi:hypothetical protein
VRAQKKPGFPGFFVFAVLFFMLEVVHISSLFFQFSVASIFAALHFFSFRI